MSWSVQYSPLAEADLEDIQDYIADILLASEAALRQTVRIVEAVSSLSEMPMRYRLYDHEPWRGLGLRVMPVDRYVVLYLPEEREDTVYVLRILYGGRDLPAQLDELRLSQFEGTEG